MCKQRSIQEQSKIQEYYNYKEDLKNEHSSEKSLAFRQNEIELNVYFYFHENDRCERCT